jgi:UDP-glucose 4-epimerase
VLHVVVTGATGNVGTSVVEALAADPRVGSILAAARRPAPGWAPAKTRFVSLDLAEDALTPHLEGADAVVHLAWLFQPTHRPTVTWQANSIGSARLFDAVARADVRALVHASSIGAYSPKPGDDQRVDETWPTHSLPTAGYGREKAYVERLLDVFEREHPGVRTVRMRPAFIFKRSSATEQRRIFAGPFAPKGIARPGRLPVLPYPAGLRFQALHTDDVADAYVRAVTGEARGAFNLASEPVLDGPALAELLGSRPLRLPRAVVRVAVATGWHARLVPADPSLYDLFMGLPLMSWSRARDELGWQPRWSSHDAIRELLQGFSSGAGGPTEPLAGDAPARRVGELASGVGQRP